MLAVPLMAFWVMPWGVIAFALLPLGQESLALVPMTLGIDAILWIAQTVSAWPGAVRLIPAMPVEGLALIAFGGLWLCLWRRGWRHMGWALMAVGVGTVAMVRPPDMLIDGEARLVAVRTPQGGLMISSPKTAKFVSGVWLRRSGNTQTAGWPGEDDSPDQFLRCDTLGCIYRAGPHIIALPFAEAALDEDCGTADVVVSKVPVLGQCPSARVVVDRFDLWRDGAHALWLTTAGARVESVRDRHGTRPWAAAKRKWRTSKDRG
jgi:competence protein ComEC